MKKVFSVAAPFLVVGIVLSLLFFFYTREQPPSLKEGDKAYVSRNYEYAITVYEAHRKSLGKNQLVNLGDSYFKTGQPEKALNLYESMAKNKELTKEYLAEFYLRMAVWELDLKNTDTAIEYYKKAIENAQSFPLKLRTKREYAYFISENPYEGELEDALTYLVELSQQPSEEFNYDIYHRLGELAYQTGRNEEAVAYWEKTLALNHQHTPTYEKLGILYLDIKSYQLALDTFKKALNYDTGNWRAYFGIAEAYANLGNSTLAVENYRKTISFNPDHMPSHFQIAEIALKKGAKNEAVEHYYIVYQKDPDSKMGKLAKEALDKNAPSAKTTPF